MSAVTEHVEGEGSGYVVRVERLDPEEEPALEKAGYHSPTTFYTVLAGGQVYAHHDRYSLIRELPGQNDWLQDHLQRLSDAVRDESEGSK